MSTGRSVCSLCRSFLLREQPSITRLPPPPKLFHTTKEILSLSRLPHPLSISPDDGTSPADQGDQPRHDDSVDPLSKETLRLLPPCKFAGKVVHIKHARAEESCADVIRQLLKNQILGFDVECSLTNNRPLLVQLASRDLSVLWQVKEGSAFPTLLHGILASPNYLKVGHGSLADARALLKFYAINTVNIFDTVEFLNSLPHHLRPPLLNLQGLVAILLGQWLSKRMARSKWNRRQLSWKQLLYASTDVWASLEVYLALMKYASEIEVMPPPSVECTLRMCKPRAIESLEQALKDNMLQSEKARTSLEELIGPQDSSESAVDRLSIEHCSGHIECAAVARDSGISWP